MKLPNGERAIVDSRKLQGLRRKWICVELLEDYLNGAASSTGIDAAGGLHETIFSMEPSCAKSHNRWMFAVRANTRSNAVMIFLLSACASRPPTNVATRVVADQEGFRTIVRSRPELQADQTARLEFSMIPGDPAVRAEPIPRRTTAR
jgi:hypothetical protein